MMSGRGMMAAAVMAVLAGDSSRRRGILVVGPEGDRMLDVRDAGDVITIDSTPLQSEPYFPKPVVYDNLVIEESARGYPTDFWNPSLRDLYRPPADERWRRYQPRPQSTDAAQRARRKAQRKARAITKRNRK